MLRVTLFVCWQGLNVIKVVVDIKGQKRFKNKDHNFESDNLELEVGRGSNAKDIFRQNACTTSYATSFGAKPKGTGDFSILREKKFSAL